MNIKRLFLTASMVALLSALSLQAGWSQQDFNGQDASTASAALSSEEAEHLIFMREEEKVARDLYLALYEQWKAPVFSSLSNSEQKHMDILSMRVAAHDLVDPVVDDTVGSFTNAVLANVYTDLVAKGLLSLRDALYVGALIEEVDILDLQKAIAVSTHPDLIQAYEDLMRDSRNHLRAFIRQIESLGVPYESQIMEPLELDMILGMPMERGRSQ